MTSQEVITYRQKPVKIIRDNKTLEFFRDENLMYVIKFLKNGPMSIQDLENAFTNIGVEKSDKTIYRYLHKLIQAKLVAKAGKRVSSVKEDDLVSETIYLRTAKAFITVQPIDLRECKGSADCPVWEVTRILIGQLIGNSGDAEKFAEFASSVDREKDEIVIKLFESADEDTLDKIADLDWQGINHVLQFAGWLALSTKMDIGKELRKSYD
ncbi:MAG TPA: hypothetical protein VMX55_06920 [candidate division Zixibacteria bacterium]|nr:hypothetical protein [candidate division Zixibacteria bacterium]